MSESRISKGPLIAAGIFVAVVAAGLWFGRNLSPPAEDTQARLEAVETAVLAYAESEGEAPPDLATLVAGGYLEAIPVNRGGHALVSERKGKFLAEIKSLGPDGKEGGFMFKRDHVLEIAIPAK